VLVIPAIDVVGGRSRVVFWPGAATGIGAPTDRPDRIAERFVAQGASVIHIVDVDGARSSVPVNLDAVGQIASRVAIPLQLAGGLEAADHIRLAFAAGATRVVLSMSIVDEPDRLRECVAVAGDWLAVGIDARADRIAAFPWRRTRAPSLESLLDELVAVGVSRVVLSHANGDDAERLGPQTRARGIDLLVAGGVHDVTGLRQLRSAGVSGVILGEALLSGAVDYSAALEAAA
jgi:phosphoribosylformimino-5-aminoimidazole carboxamide ribotide isomerase